MVQHETKLLKYVPDCVWPSKNEYGIPDLDINMQAQCLDLPFVQWDDIKKLSSVNGTLGFYTHDRNFVTVWESPERVIKTGIINAVEANFSTNEQMPRAVVLSRIYMKRWLSRYWQSQGIRILVDLNVGSNCQNDNLLGVPHGWTAYATRGYSNHPELIKYSHAKACKRAGHENILFVVYGGGKACQKVAEQLGAIWIIDKMHYLTYVRRGKDMSVFDGQHIQRSVV